MDYIPWLLMVWTVATMWLAGNKSPLAWYSGIASQGLWLVFDYYVEAWGLMPLAIILTFVYARNLLRWRRELVPVMVPTPTQADERRAQRMRDALIICGLAAATLLSTGLSMAASMVSVWLSLHGGHGEAIQYLGAALLLWALAVVVGDNLFTRWKAT